MQKTSDALERRSGISRRATAALLGLAPWLARSADAPSGRSWRIGQSTALTGPLGDLGTAISNGAKACFAEVNASGGVHGRPIELVTQDDGYDVARALAIVDRFIKDPSILSLFNCMGTPAVGAMLPKVIQSGMPFFAPFTGAQSARPKDARNVIHIRPTYGEEAGKLTQHLATIGIRQIAVAYQDNAFGREVLKGVEAAAEHNRLPAPSAVSVNADGSDLATAVAAVANGGATAVILGLAGKPAIDFIKAVRSLRRGMSLYAVSVLGGAATISALGEDGVGIAISQVVPSPLSALPVVRDFRAAWKAAGMALEPSHLALEGYINARAFVAALQRAGATANQRNLIDSVWSMKRVDLGGFEISFVEPGKSASAYVDLTMVSSSGRLIR